MYELIIVSGMDKEMPGAGSQHSTALRW